MNKEKLIELNEELKVSSVFSKFFYKMNEISEETKKKVLLTIGSAFTFSLLALPMSNTYINDTLTKNIANQDLSKQERLVLLLDNYFNALESNKLFNVLNSISTSMSNLVYSTNGHTSADIYVDEMKNIITTSFDGKSLQDKINNLDKEKEDLLKFHKVSKESTDFSKINKMFEVEKEKLLSQFNIIETYNQKIVDIKESKGLNFSDINKF